VIDSTTQLAGRLALVALTVACARFAPSDISAPVTVFTHVTVIDVVGGSAIPNQTVVVKGNRIAEIRASQNDPVQSAATVVDASGTYMIPGLWDMHVHAFTAPESTLTVGARAVNLYLPQFLSWGVTGIRDMGGWIDTVMTVRRRVRSHEIPGPRIVAAGALIGGRNPWAPPSPHAWVVTNADSAARTVDSLRRAGADFIKVHDFLTREVYFAVAAAARRVKLPLVGHLRPSVTLAEAIDMGQVGIEHLPIELVVACARGGRAEANAFYDQWINGGWTAFIRGTVDMWDGRDRGACVAVLARMKQSGVRVTPTSVLRIQDSTFVAELPMTQLSSSARTVCSQNVNDWGSVADSLRQTYYRVVADIERTIHEAGIPVLAGTDGPGGCLTAGWSLHKELENLVSSGFTPLEALRAATVEPARFLAVADSIGAIRSGMVADLVLLDANPLDDIRNTRQIAAVMADGCLVIARASARTEGQPQPRCAIITPKRKPH
jgi:Amidohydrolase family